MSLKHVLLGSLYEEPQTGFDLKKIVDGAVSQFWRAELSQIYPTLKRMQDESLVTCDVQTRNKVYHITDAGRNELLRWIKEPSELTTHREAFMVKIYFGAHLNNDEIVSIIGDQRQKHAQKLAEYERALAGATAGIPAMKPAEARDYRIKLLTLRGGIKYHRFWIAWCDEAASEVSELPELPGDGRTEQ